MKKIKKIKIKWHPNSDVVLKEMVKAEDYAATHPRNIPARRPMGWYPKALKEIPQAKTTVKMPTKKGIDKALRKGADQTLKLMKKAGIKVDKNGIREKGWSYNPYRATLYLDGKFFALVSPDGRNALSTKDAEFLVDLLNLNDNIMDKFLSAVNMLEHCFIEAEEDIGTTPVKAAKLAQNGVKCYRDLLEKYVQRKYAYPFKGV